MKRSWLLIMGFSLLVLLGTVLVTFPAVLAWNWWGTNAPGLTLQGVSGTLWKGSAMRASVRGQALGRLDWQLSPWRTITGNPQIQVQLSGTDLNLSALIAARGEHEIAITALNAQAQAGWLAPVLAIPALEPTGMLVTQNANMVLTRLGLPRDIDAQLEWRDAGVRGQVVARLGTLQISARGSNGLIDASVNDRGDGDLEVRGNARLDQGNYRVETILVPRVSAGPIVEALQWIGAPRMEGGRLLVVEGRVDVGQETL